MIEMLGVGVKFKLAVDGDNWSGLAYRLDGNGALVLHGSLYDRANGFIHSASTYRFSVFNIAVHCQSTPSDKR